MAKRGTKPQSDELKLLKGTFKPYRERGRVVPELEGEPGEPPKWLDGEALEIWQTKVGIYERRGQSIVGCEGALAQYCAAEAKLIGLYKAKVDVPVPLITAHRVYANEFYDTPASQQAAGTKRAPENRFTRNGQQPAVG